MLPRSSPRLEALGAVRMRKVLCRERLAPPPAPRPRSAHVSEAAVTAVVSATISAVTAAVCVPLALFALLDRRPRRSRASALAHHSGFPWSVSHPHLLLCLSVPSFQCARAHLQVALLGREPFPREHPLRAITKVPPARCAQRRALDGHLAAGILSDRREQWPCSHGVSLD